MTQTVKWRSIVIVAFLCASAHGQNLIRNPGFEQGLKHWAQRVSQGMGSVKLSTQAASGKYCALIYKTVSTRQFSSVGVAQKVPVEPNALYEISFRCKTALEPGAVGWAFRVFVSDSEGSRHKVVGSRPKWETFTMEFDTGSKTHEVNVEILLTYSSGKIWLDDVMLRRIGQSIEAESLPLPAGARVIEDRSLSGGRGVALTASASLRLRQPLPAGPVAVVVYGRGGESGDLWPRAVNVAAAHQTKTVDLHKHDGKHHGRIAFFHLADSRSGWLSVSRSPSYKGDVVIDRIYWHRHKGPAKVKPLYLETPLVRNGKPNGVIVASASPFMQQLAQKLQRAIADSTGARLPIEIDESYMRRDYRAKNAVVIGNLLQNKLAERLYCLWYTREDAWYPGKGGYVVRPVHDPWGTGKNVIVLAGSDDAGTAAAVDAFTATIKPGRNLVVGPGLRVKMADNVARAIGKPDPAYARRSLNRRSQRSLVGNSARAAIAYLYTGDPGWAKVFLTYLMEHKRRPELGHDTHMELWQVVRGWDLLEECPVFTDEDRLEVTNYLLYVLRSSEGVNQGMFVSSLGYSSIRHNHHMLAALDAYYGARYFGLYYSLPEAEDWLRKARFCFASQELQDKGQDESGDYEGSTSLRPLALFAVEEPGYRFLPSGTGKRFIDRVCMSIDNRFSSSGHGDCWDVNCFPRQALSLMAWYYRDGRYQYILEGRFKQFERERDRWTAEPLFRMDGQLAPRRPVDLEGVCTAPINKEFYRFFKKRQAGRVLFNLPPERGFDKLSFRTAFEPDKQYLLLDGIGFGSHGHADTNCIVRFTDNDRVWLVDDSYTEGPFLGDHNGVLVTCDGVAGLLPACARLDAAADLGLVGFSRTTAPDHSGTDWERNIFWAKERWFVVLDRLIARRVGDYAFRCLWRTLGVAELRGNDLVTRQAESTPQRGDELHLIHLSNVRTSLRTDRDVFGKKWAKRYPYAKPIVNIFSQDASEHMKRGESFVFANLFYATNRDNPQRFTLSRVDDETYVVNGDETFVMGLADVTRDVAGLRVRAGEFIVWNTGCALARAITLAVSGRKVLDAPKPVNILIDGRANRVIVEAKGEASVELLGRTRRIRGRKEFDLKSIGQLDFASIVKRAASRATTAISKRPRIQKPGHAINAVWTFNAGASVTALATCELPGAADVAVVIGTADGRAVAVSSSGKRLWTFSGKGRQNAIGTGDVTGDGTPEIALASEDTHVYVLNTRGKLVWQFKCPRYAKRGGKYGEARAVLVTDIDRDGKSEVIVGANNIQLHVLDSSGRVRFTSLSSDSKVTFDNLFAFDADGDGRLDIFSFPSSGSFGRWHRWDSKGRHERGRTDGWPSHIPAATIVDLDGDGRTDVAIGTNRGTLYFIRQGEGRLKQEKVFYVGCQIVAAAGHSMRKRPGLVAVGTEMCYLFVLNGRGKVVWKTSVETPPVALTYLGRSADPVLAVATQDGSALFFSARGKLLGKFHHDARTTAIAALPRPLVSGAALAVGYDDGTVAMLELSLAKHEW